MLSTFALLDWSSQPTDWATMQESVVDHMIACELERFVVNDYRGRDDAPAFELVEGSMPVMLSAPHAVTHWRDGRVKPSDDYTGSLVLELARASGAHAIVATRFSHSDPNWDSFEKSAYKQALARHIAAHGIRVLLDIHGMVAASPALVALGTADGETVAPWPDFVELVLTVFENSLAEPIKRHGKGVTLNASGYAATGENTVSRTIARECCIPCLQVELATQIRVPSSRGMHIPKQDPAPFVGNVLAAEIAARRNPDPLAVERTFEALRHLVLMIEQDLPSTKLH